MIDFKLTQKLHEAGYPQNKWDGEIVSDNILYEDESGWHMDSAYAPTLSELIKECGIHFEALTVEQSHPPEWNAIAFHSDKHGRGSTPEEAVANLWLKLKGK